ncbi:nuclear transcription factor Y subunit gamma-like isoform X1 [Olea europaea subsp. europaea]|uniref:Nuclear transcription factor Y subunit gamma-like isoform X1 n=1 Tax=Olea europaea subsp. europaea TaxID=158383 RepID=A0A8S0VA26_OLEEU|nr:nuclear transcription factor Y subunit gamma-like isoform X1 [Olea europaea subsp. europaea]
MRQIIKIAKHSLKKQDGAARSSHFMILLKQNMLTFWKERLVEIRNSRDIQYKHLLPFARIRKIISADTPILFAKACEIFILDLTLRAWMNAEDNSRQSLQPRDVFTAIMGEELLSFLAKIVSSDRYEALLMRSQEAPQHLVFPQSFSAAETNYRQGSNEQRVADCPGGTDQYSEYPMYLHNLNSVSDTTY